MIMINVERKNKWHELPIDQRMMSLQAAGTSAVLKNSSRGD